MKVNFAKTRRAKENKVPWLNELIVDFLQEHDIDPTHQNKQYPRSVAGTRAFGDWLVSKGWQVAYWELPPYPDYVDNDRLVYIGYGLDFNDQCPYLVEALLSQQ